VQSVFTLMKPSSTTWGCAATSRNLNTTTFFLVFFLFQNAYFFVTSLFFVFVRFLIMLSSFGCLESCKWL
jgi:hypothetical protein